jgi:hypothetical protein
VALTKVDEYDPSVAASLPRIFSSAPIRSLISQVCGSPAVQGAYWELAIMTPDPNVQPDSR